MPNADKSQKNPIDPDTRSAALREQVLHRMEALHQASLYPVGREKLIFGLDSSQDQVDAAVASLVSEALMEEPEAGWYKLTEAGRAAARGAIVKSCVWADHAAARS